MLQMILLISVVVGFGEQTFLDKYPHTPCSKCKIQQHSPPPASSCVAKPDHRINCGSASDSGLTCRNKGCCWDDSVPGARWCFQPAGKQNTTKTKGQWIPNDDPAEKNMFCLDCTLDADYYYCKDAGCPVGPAPPTPPPTPRPPPPPRQCSGCSAGKIWVNGACLDCNAQQNYRACAAAGCG